MTLQCRMFIDRLFKSHNRSVSFAFDFINQHFTLSVCSHTITLSLDLDVPIAYSVFHACLAMNSIIVFTIIHLEHFRGLTSECALLC